jgi:adenine/guanine phosphoribosyltransferase-like PRPP-binding protein
LPGEVVEQAYQTEYSEGILAIHKNIDITGPVMIIDDILATGRMLLAEGALIPIL